MHYRLVIRSQYERWRTGDIPFFAVTVANPEVSDVLSEVEKKPGSIFNDLPLPSHIAGISSRIRTGEKNGLINPPVVICASCIGLTWVRSQYRPLKTLKSVVIYLPCRIHDEHRNIFLASQAVYRGASSVATCCAKDGQVLPIFARLSFVPFDQEELK